MPISLLRRGAGIVNPVINGRAQRSLCLPPVLRPAVRVMCHSPDGRQKIKSILDRLTQEIRKGFKTDASDFPPPFFLPFP